MRISEPLNASTTIVQEDMALLVRCLPGAFCWAQTKEGWNFWSDVHARIARIAREGR